MKTIVSTISVTIEEVTEVVLIAGAIEIHLVAGIEAEVVEILLEMIEEDLGNHLEIEEDLGIHLAAMEGVGVLEVEEVVIVEAEVGIEEAEVVIEEAKVVIVAVEGEDGMIEGAEVDSTTETVLNQNQLKTRK